MSSKSCCRRGFIIVDVQEDFTPPVGSLAVNDGRAVLAPINAMRQKDAEWQNIHSATSIMSESMQTSDSTLPATIPKFFTATIVTQDWHPQDHCSFAIWPPHCLAESKGAQLLPDLIVRQDDIRVKKGVEKHVDFYSAFFSNDYKESTQLVDVVQKLGLDEVYVCGLALDFCVGATAMDAKQRIHIPHVAVVTDACRGVSKDSSDKMLEQMHKAGIELLDSNEVLKRMDEFHRSQSELRANSRRVSPVSTPSSPPLCSSSPILKSKEADFAQPLPVSHSHSHSSSSSASSAHCSPRCDEVECMHE